ncbi:MAG: FGGY family carbohydrate kinase [Nocardioides sp.]
MSGPYVIGCDVGSQGTNAALFTVDGTLVASSYQEHRLSYPRPGWAEQDPTEWLDAIRAGVRRLVDGLPAGGSAVKAISFGSQLDGVVVCDARRRPLRPALIWMDRRAEDQAAELAKRIAPADFYGAVGVNLDSSHAVFKALWVRDNEPDVFTRAALLLPPGAYVVGEVTGEVACDYSNASSLGLLDVRTRHWSQPVLDAAEIAPEMLPRLVGGTEVVGTVAPGFAEATGLAPSCLVVAGCGDEMSATLGAGVFAPGEVCDVVGTAEPVCAVTLAPRADPTMLVECHPHGDADTWLMENPGFVSGGNLRWWRDHFGATEREAEARGGPDAYVQLVDDAAEVPAGADGLLFLPCMQGAMSPEWNGAARAAFFGLTLAHTRAHLTRAVLEGSAFALRDILLAMVAAGVDVHRVTIVGGGAKSDLWRQIKADVIGLPVRTPTNVETTATGAAILAAVGGGEHASVADAVDAFVSYEPREYEPDAERHQQYLEAHARYRELYFALKPLSP